MNRLLPLSTPVLAACLFAACSPQVPAPQVAETPRSEEADEGGRDGPLVPMMTCDSNAMFNASTTQASLIAAHGAENIREQKVPWVDSELDAIVLFPDNPAMQAEVLWLGDKAGMPRAARVSGGPQSLWVGPEGLLLGATIADIEAANGGPFMMTAFENHNHGEVSNFLGGKLDAEVGGCRVSLTLDAARDTPQSVLAALSGGSEKFFRSDSTAMLAMQPVLAEMTILFSTP